VVIDVSNERGAFALHFFWQTAASGCEGFPAFRELTPSPSSRCVGGLVAPKLHFQDVLVVW
jgi:hypothetical protein